QGVVGLGVAQQVGVVLIGADVQLGHLEGAVGVPVWRPAPVDVGGVGRTEGPDAFAQAIRSAEQHLLSLPGETRISPGHGDDTLVEREVPQLDEWKARGW
ncbi:MAG TPA: MBL fold metallo-hydrolase, partial [Actinomycetes bacterium]|nr:MBL fold metallo-hydrolase [Actinomycetes bacterium]